MLYPPITHLAVLSIGFAIIAFSRLPTQAQTYPGETNFSLYGHTSGTDALHEYSYSGTGFDSTLDYLKRKNEEARERREIQERESRRMFEEQNLFRNTPEKLLDSYFRRADSPYGRR